MKKFLTYPFLKPMLLIGMAILMDLKLLKKNHTWEELWSVLPLTLSLGYFAAYYYELFKLPYAKKYDKFQTFILYALYIAASAFLIMLFGLLTPSINYNFSGIYSLLGGFLGGELFKFFNTSQWKKWKSKTLPILIQCAIFLLIIFLLIILYIDSEIKQSKNFNICDIFRIDLLTFFILLLIVFGPLLLSLYYLFIEHNSKNEPNQTNNQQVHNKIESLNQDSIQIFVQEVVNRQSTNIEISSNAKIESQSTEIKIEIQKIGNQTTEIQTTRILKTEPQEK